MQKRIKRLLYVIVLNLILSVAVVGTNYYVWAEVKFGPPGSESLFQYIRTDLTQGYIEAMARGSPPSVS